MVAPPLSTTKTFAAIEGVIGNFGVGNSSCQATGIFGGTAQPH
jgi:hypothetical protein